jgi:inorganic pyrophosphatase
MGMGMMSLSTLSTYGSNGSVHVVVESPRGSTVKLKYDAALNAITLSRPLIEGLSYPFDWGFVPSTCAADGDPLDAMILWDRATFPGVVVPCRLIGLLAVEQNSKQRPGTRERNDRVIGVPWNAPKYHALKEVRDVESRVREELEAFFAGAAAFEDKDLKFLQWAGASAAYDLVKASIAVSS